MDRINLFRFMLNEQDKSRLELYLFTAVTSRPEIDWDSYDIKNSTTSAKFFAQKLSEFRDIKEIHLHINSPGGEISEGTAIRNLLKSHPAKVTAYIDGWACSIASVIATAADEVIMYSNSLMYIHSAWCGIQGNAEQLRAEADALDKMTDAAINCYVEKSGGKADRERFAQLVKSESWLTAQECFDLGLCDKVEDSTTTGAAEMLEDMRKHNMSAEFGGSLDKLISLLERSAAKDPEPTKPPESKAEEITGIFKNFMKI